MILKVFRDRVRDRGWVYVADVEEIQVDEVTWGVRRAVDRVYEICDMEFQSEHLDRSDCHLLFDPGVVVANLKKGEIQQLRVLTALFKNGNHGSFVIEDDRSSWLMSDDGSTIDRL